MRKDKIENIVDEVPEAVEETPIVVQDNKPLYVTYIGGSGLTLEYPLEDGRRTLPGHVPVKLENYQDFVRLTSAQDGLFIVCDEKGKPVGK
jgi:hypothetical protein